MPGDQEDEEPPVADREVLPPGPAAPDEDDDTDEEDAETDNAADEKDEESVSTADGDEDSESTADGDEDSESTADGDEEEEAPDTSEETRPGEEVVDPDQAPEVDLSESWVDIDDPVTEYQAGAEDADDETAQDDEADEGDADDGEAEVSGDGEDEAEEEASGAEDDESEDGGDEDEDKGDEEDEEKEDEEDQVDGEADEAGDEDDEETDEVGDEDDDEETDEVGDEDDDEEPDEAGDEEDDDEAEEAGDEDDDETVDEADDDQEKVEFHDDATPLERKTGPTSDQEQPLADHIEEMIRRLAIVIVVAGLVSLLAFPFGEDFIVFLWYSVLPADVSQPHVYHPLELVITQLKAASLLGLILALPVFVYETYAFMRPGLYPHERRYYLAAVPTSLVLAAIGLLFGYFLVLPAVMTYFLYYSRDVVDIAFALGQTFNLMLILLGYLALVFQIPLFIMLAIMMGLTTRTWLEDRRLIFWGAFLGISFLFSPDPTGMAPILVAATMIALFEGTLLLLRWTRRGG